MLIDTWVGLLLWSVISVPRGGKMFGHFSPEKATK